MSAPDDDILCKLESGILGVMNTHNKRPHCHVSPSQHPEGPGREPAIPLTRCNRQDLLLQQFPQHRPVAALVDARDGNGQLKVLQLTETDLNGTVEPVS